MNFIRKYVPKWSSLRIVGNSYPAKLSTVMPFVGYIILSQEYVVTALSMIVPSQAPKIANHDPGLTFFLVYFGLFIFGLGSFGFFLICDLDVKNHIDADSFYIYKKLNTSTYDIVNYCKYIVEKEEKESESSKVASSTLRGIESGVQAIPSDESRLIALKTYYTIKDKSFIYIRFIIFLLFSIRLTLLAIPAFITFYKVSRLFIVEFM